MGIEDHRNDEIMDTNANTSKLVNLRGGSLDPGFMTNGITNPDSRYSPQANHGAGAMPPGNKDYGLHTSPVRTWKPPRPEFTTPDPFAESTEEGMPRQIYGILPREKLRQPFQPESKSYEAMAHDPQRKAKIALLGIDESRAQPAEKPQVLSGRGTVPMFGLDRWSTLVGMGDNRNLADLKTGDWRPTRLGFHIKWPQGIEEFHSQWVELVLVHLYLRVAEFAARCFQHGDIPSTPSTRDSSASKRKRSLWKSAGFSPTFLHYASLVAKQDNNAGGWDILLESKLHRKYLVTGMVNRVLQTKVFDELLFGATDKTKAILDAQDLGIIDNEGYSRTNLRGHTVRTILGNKTLTDNFWPDVDSLAYQMTEMFLPLVQLMDKYFTESQQTSTRSIYQNIHHIVSEAAYLSIGIRCSRDIFRFSWPIPGQTWELDEIQADETIYKLSREANEKIDEEAGRRWERRQRRQAKAATRADKNRSRTIWNKTWSLAKRAVDWVTGRGRSEAADNNVRFNSPTLWTPPSHLAKVQIALLPTLRRYAKAPKECDTNRTPGEYITLVSKARVIYYVGRVDDEGDYAESKPTLHEWVGEGSSWPSAVFRFPKRQTLQRLAVGALLLAAAGWLLDVLAARGFLLPRVIVGLVKELLRYIGIGVLTILIVAIRYLTRIVQYSSLLTYMTRAALEHGSRWVADGAWFGGGGWLPSLPSFPGRDFVQGALHGNWGGVGYTTVTVKVPTGIIRAHETQSVL